MGENAGSLTGVFVVFIILTLNLLPNPNKCMGLLQYIFQEVRLLSKEVVTMYMKHSFFLLLNQ